MGAPSDQFLRIKYGGPFRSVSLFIMEASLCLFFILYGGPQLISLHTILGPPDHFLRLQLLTIWSPSDQFLLIQYGGPSQISFIVYYMRPPLRSVSLHAIGGPPQILFFSQNVWGPSQISFSAYYMGPPQVSFFAYYMGAPSGQFLRLLYGGPLR